MKKIFFYLIAFIVLFSCKDSQNKLEATKSSDEASQLFFNGDILTMNSEMPQYAEAIVEQNGIIAFVGSMKEAESKYANTKMVDLEGKTLLPGFIRSAQPLRYGI